MPSLSPYERDVERIVASVRALVHDIVRQELGGQNGAFEYFTTGNLTYKLLHVNHYGPHSGDSLSSFAIFTEPQGSGVNGAANADYSLSIVNGKKGYFSSQTADQGEIDGMGIFVRQKGPAGGGSDCGGLLINVGSNGTCGNLTGVEGVTYNFADDGITQLQASAYGMGGINGVTGGCNGYVYRQMAGATFTNWAYYGVANAGAKIDAFLRYEDENVAVGVGLFEVDTNGTIISRTTIGNPAMVCRGNSQPTVVWNPTSGSTKLGQVIQIADTFTLGSTVANWFNLNLVTGAISCQNITSPQVSAFYLVIPHFANTVLVNGLNSDVPFLNGSDIRITGPTGAFSLGGIGQFGDGYKAYVYNASGQQMTIVNNDASSTPANRIDTLTGGNVVLRAGSSFATFGYDTVASRWILQSTN